MASRLLQIVRKELVSPFVEQPKRRFSSQIDSGKGIKTVGPGATARKTPKIELTPNEQRVQTFLSVLAVFLPGVYIGHVITNHGIVEDLKGDSEKDNISKEKGGKDGHRKF